MPTYFLNRDVYYCETDRGAVFLNLESGKYFGLNLASLQQVRLSVHGWTGSPTADGGDTGTQQGSCALIQSMIDRGLITPSRHQGRIPSKVCVQTREAVHCGGVRHSATRSIRLSDVGHFIASYVLIVVSLRLFGLTHLIRRLESKKCPRSTTLCTEDVKDVVNAFHTIRPWVYTAKSACLIDSLTLSEFLMHYQIAPTFVIGVKTKPFAAHAWVQVGDHVLNDSVDYVRGYTPLLAV